MSGLHVRSFFERFAPVSRAPSSTLDEDTSPTSTFCSGSSHSDCDRGSPAHLPIHTSFSLHSYLKLDLRNLDSLHSDAMQQTSNHTASITVTDAISANDDQSKDAPTILILGSAGSGKSTLIKQLVLRYGTESSLRALKGSCRMALYCRVIDHVRQALNHNQDHRLAYGIAILRIRLAPILALEANLRAQLQCRPGLPNTNSETSFNQPLPTESIAPHIFAALSQDIQDLLQGCEVEIDPYLAASLSRICSQTFVPSWDDILHHAHESNGIEEHFVNLPDFGAVRLCDVSKSGGKRPIWVRFFEDAALIIYLLDVSSFDQPSGKASNHLEESFRQLDKLRKDPMLRKVNIHIIFNKRDVLKLKIKHGAPFHEAMPGFYGRHDSYRAALAYLKVRVDQIAQDDRPKTALGAHLRTRSIDSEATDCTKAVSIENLVDVLTSKLSASSPGKLGITRGLQSFLHV